MASILIEEAIRARAGRATALRSPFGPLPEPEPLFKTSLCLSQHALDAVRAVMIAERRDSRNQVITILLEEALDARDAKAARAARAARRKTA